MRVRVNSLYRYDPCLLDIIDSKTSLTRGDIVRVINLPSAPKANTMGQCYVANPFTGEFLGMVSTSSLETASKGTKALVRKAVRKARA